jgi:acetamidase/formamidase
VLTCGRTFGVARKRAVVAMMELLEHRLDLEPAEALALISVAGDLRVGQAVGGRVLTLRLEISRATGIELDRSPG